MFLCAYLNIETLIFFLHDILQFWITETCARLFLRPMRSSLPLTLLPHTHTPQMSARYLQKCVSTKVLLKTCKIRRCFLSKMAVVWWHLALSSVRERGAPGNSLSLQHLPRLVQWRAGAGKCCRGGPHKVLLMPPTMDHRN